MTRSGEQVIHTNLDSLFNMTRPVINGMREREITLVFLSRNDDVGAILLP